MRDVGRIKKMNIRQKINRQVTPLVIGFFSCFVFFFPIGLVTEKNSSLFPLFLIPFAIAGICIVWLSFIKCPSCHSRIGALGSVCPQGIPFRISSKIKFCPFCGINLDEDIETIANQRTHSIADSAGSE
jgi:hypothetical protein